MKADTSAACLSIWWKEMKGGICVNPDEKSAKTDHPAKNDQSTFYPTTSSTYGTVADVVDSGGQFELFQCFEPCDVLQQDEDFSLCPPSWTFYCDVPYDPTAGVGCDEDTEECFFIDAIKFLSMSSGLMYDKKSGKWETQTVSCELVEAVPCEPDPNDPEACGSCGYNYTVIETYEDAAPCEQAGLVANCEYYANEHPKLVPNK
jgi:hypothetical protein